MLAPYRWGNMAIDDAIRVQATPVVDYLRPLVEQVGSVGRVEGGSHDACCEI